MIAELSIILVNYNTCELTMQCIDSVVEKTSDSLKYEIILVDNDSKDGSQELFAKDDRIVYIQSGANLGFGKANNLGVEHAKGDYLLLLNTDTILLEDSLSILLSFFKKYESEMSIGTLGCQLVSESQESADSSFSFCTTHSIIREIVLRKPNHSAHKQNDSDVQRVDYVSGACMLFRREVYQQVGGFDRDFFMYFEEADLQKRLQVRNLCSYVLNSTRIIHLEGGSSDKTKGLSNSRRIMIQQGRNLYLKKNDEQWYWLYVVFDFLYSLLRIWNPRYTLRENLHFFKSNIQSY